MSILHGLVPPHMLGPTFPMWITPPAVAQLQQLAQQQLLQQAQQPNPAPAPKPKQKAEPPKPKVEEHVASGMKVMRTEPEKHETPAYHPVLPVFGVDTPVLPLGTRERRFWM